MTPSPTERASGLYAALRAALPEDAQQHAEPLAKLLMAVVRDELTAEQAAVRISGDQSLAEAVRRLAGTRVSGGAGVVSFGTGSQTGDVTISGVAGRDIVINVPQPGGLTGRRFWWIAGSILVVAALVVAGLLPDNQPAALTVLRMRPDQTFEQFEVRIDERPLGLGLMPL